MNRKPAPPIRRLSPLAPPRPAPVQPHSVAAPRPQAPHVHAAIQRCLALPVQAASPRVATPLAAPRPAPDAAAVQRKEAAAGPKPTPSLAGQERFTGWVVYEVRKTP